MRAFKDKRILVTGGTGSFGRRLVRRVLDDGQPERIIVFSRDEFKQHDIRSEFRGERRLEFFIGNVRDERRLHRAFQAGLDVVIHAAALKQVPACEYNPFEAVKTNILGAHNVINAAIDCNVPKVIGLSTDKAVSPTNLYGATKLCAEKLFIQGNSYAGGRATRFCCVRYGNVLGSRGSIIPLFRQQREQGKVTVTDPRMTRFWLTLDQAIEFVSLSLERMVGGEVFVPRIPSLGIMELAKTIAPGCDIECTGIRPGEKLHECLVSVDEARHTKALDDMFVILPEYHRWGDVNWKDADGLPDGFSFNSDTNDRWLSDDELRQMVETH